MFATPSTHVHTHTHTTQLTFAHKHTSRQKDTYIKKVGGRKMDRSLVFPNVKTNRLIAESLITCIKNAARLTFTVLTRYGTRFPALIMYSTSYRLNFLTAIERIILTEKFSMYSIQFLVESLLHVPYILNFPTAFEGTTGSFSNH